MVAYGGGRDINHIQWKVKLVRDDHVGSLFGVAFRYNARKHPARKNLLPSSGTGFAQQTPTALLHSAMPA
jgi:hypothetical protein